MNINFVIDPTHVIQRQLWECYGSGPASYLAAGDPLLFNNSQFPSCVGPCLTQSGNYELKPFPSITGNLRPLWTWIWMYSGKQGVTIVQNAAGTGMTPGTVVPITFSGGTGGGAAGTVTVLTATTISINITSTGSYSSAPTATIAGTGGTPATLTVSTAPASGVVPAGTNLSGETAQFFIMGGEM